MVRDLGDGPEDGERPNPSPHPLPPVPLPHQPGVASLTDPHPRFPRPIHRLPRPADITPADLRPHPFKRPVIQNPRERLHLRWPLCLTEAVVAEILPAAAPLHGGCRPLPADMTGFVLCHREGEVVPGVHRSTRLHIYTRLHIFAPNFAPRKTPGCGLFPDRAHLLANSRYVCTSADFTDTPGGGTRPFDRALRSR